MGPRVRGCVGAISSACASRDLYGICYDIVDELVQVGAAEVSFST